VPSPKLALLLLTDSERASLEALVRKRTASQSLALRARIVLACAEDGGIAPLTAVGAGPVCRGAGLATRCTAAGDTVVAAEPAARAAPVAS
jgi:hypothetical protein